MLRIWSSDLCLQRRTILSGLLVLSCLGCNKSAPSPAGPVSTAQGEPGDHADHVPESVEPSTSVPTNEDPRSRTKWVGDIPYDVFFDKPLAVAAEEHAFGTSEHSVSLSRSDRDASSDIPGGRRQVGTDPDALGGVAGSPGASSIDWQQLADTEVLNEEVKLIRNRLTTNLRTVATYNRNFESVTNDAVVLAATAAVIAVHPGSLSWKEKADWVRDLSAEMAAQAGETGREAFSATQIPFEQIVVILDGGPPPDGDAADHVPFSDVADRSEMMKRIKRSFDWLKAEINTELNFRRSSEDIVREASLLALFGGLVSTPSYDYADEPQYQQFVREFIDGNVGMTAAVTAGNYQDFITARDHVQNSCAACHGEYAFGDEGL